MHCRIILENSHKKHFFLIFKAMEIQKENCARILGTVESPRLLEELFELFDTKSDMLQLM